jgi:CDP-paratose 2-epimerase
MNVVIVTGSGGLIGSETVRFFHEKGFKIVGIDNDMRSYYFGLEASTKLNVNKLKNELVNYSHYNYDIRDYKSIQKIFHEYSTSIVAVIHTAAQPSHDWAAREPFTDFGVNATGTLNLLEATRCFSNDAVFIFTSTNKVYGDRPNILPLIETDLRWEIDPSHPFATHGIDESLSIDNTKHSIFGASKVAADILVQEYGRYFGIKTGIFRGGCLTGPAHRGAELHGFLSYLIDCAIKSRPYNIYGYKGKQVRDNIHSRDLINAFWEFFKSPKSGEVYNVGGSRFANVSILESINMIHDISGHKLKYTILDVPRNGDHIWYISDIRKFQSHFPAWNLQFDIRQTITDILHTILD